MPLYKTKEILDDAQKRGYGVAAYNAMDMCMIRACIAAAERVHAPIIIGPSQNQCGKYADSALEWYAAKAIDAARGAKVPVAIHLDHTKSFDLLMQALRHGFGSIMFDGSDLPYEENVAKSAEMVKIAHAMGIGVESELGLVGKEGGNDEIGNSKADIANQYTDPSLAADFGERTGIDFLAVSIGTTHCVRFYTVPPKLDFGRLQKIRETTSAAIVLHGASALGDENYNRAVECGVVKFNIYNEMAVAAQDAIGANADKPYSDIMLAAEEAMSDRIALRISSLGAAGKATY